VKGQEELTSSEVINNNSILFVSTFHTVPSLAHRNIIIVFSPLPPSSSEKV